MKKSLIAKIVGLGASLVSLILLFVGKVGAKMKVSAGDYSVSEKDEGRIWEIITNKDDIWDDVTFRTVVVIAFALVLVAAIYFAVSVILEVLGKELPTAKLDLVGAIILLAGAVVFAFTQFVAYKDSETMMGVTATMKMTLQTLSCVTTYIMLVAGAGAVAAQVVLKD